jgi:hypothetical protein
MSSVAAVIDAVKAPLFDLREYTSTEVNEFFKIPLATVCAVALRMVKHLTFMLNVLIVLNNV